ncbi:MAG: hypothetical protein ACTHMO_01335 [Rhodanobacteraceae bacterium]
MPERRLGCCEREIGVIRRDRKATLDFLDCAIRIFRRHKQARLADPQRREPWVILQRCVYLGACDRNAA